MSDLTGKKALVVGASRGLGRGIGEAFAQGGASVIAVARGGEALAEGANARGAVRLEVADAADPDVASRLLDTHRPNIVVLVAGAHPYVGPLQDQTWETFSVNWHTDVRIAFEWLRRILLEPLRPGSLVIVLSSGAALAGSPLSGGYAGAKATQRFITAYAQAESQRAGLGITFTAVLPQLAPTTERGRSALQAYAARSGQTEESYLLGLGTPLTPESAGAALVDLARLTANSVAAAYLLTGTGLRPL